VIRELENVTESPKGAAQVARVIQLTHGTSATGFVVGTRMWKMHRVDLIEEPGRLDRDHSLLSGLVYDSSSAIQIHHPAYPGTSNGNSHLPG
jgi:hypothetical protein